MIQASKSTASRAAFLSAIALTIAACGPQGDKDAVPAENREANSELRWARAALERNPELKVEAVDDAKQSIRVRVKSTGAIVNVSPGELAAIPIADLVALTTAPKVAQSEPSPQAQHVTEEPAAPEPEPQPPPAAPTASDYKVVRDGDRVRIVGPGVNIESSGPNDKSSAPLKKADEPIICEGQRTLFLDRRRMSVQGDAIIARNGCELHISNSEINASGTGIVVQNATLHVGNSTVQGGEASIDMKYGAKLYLQNSQFIGISRRDPEAKITDQGGNTWR